MGWEKEKKKKTAKTCKKVNKRGENMYCIEQYKHFCGINSLLILWVLAPFCVYLVIF